MIRIYKFVFIFLLVFSAPTCVRAQGASDVVFQSMSDELHRSMSQLKLPGAPAPYFLAYRITDFDSYLLEYRYGAFLSQQRNQHRNLNIELRVGTPDLDNTNYFDSYQDVNAGSYSLPEESVYGSLRHQLWLYTDRMYKDALDRYSRKIAYLQINPEKDSVPDFAENKPFEYMGKFEQLSIDENIWKKNLENLNPVFLQFPLLKNWNVVYSQFSNNTWYLNSQKSKYFQGDVIQYLSITATTQTEDGQRLTNFLFYETPGQNELPKISRIEQDLKHMLDELTSVTRAQRLDEYYGPVLFMDWAAAQLMSQLFVEPLSLTRKPLAPGLENLLPVGKLATKLKQHIFPEFISIDDQPQLTEWEGVPLVGSDRVDAEGVETQNITLIEKGQLVNLPMSRQPTKKITASNGHALASPYQMNIPGISNLMIRSSQSMSVDKLLKELRRRCKERDAEYGLLVTKLESPYFNKNDQWLNNKNDDHDSRSMLSAPLMVYKVYTKDGRMEPVRGLEFEDADLRTLKDIVSVGNDRKVYNLMQSTIFAGDYYTASIITPSILIDDMSLKSRSSQTPKPVLSNPIFK